ncbi:hypothetical protein ACFQE1_11025 [Halobium palmae]|uniref:DUF7979 domain-containing protein n=1 Tax=Halobium palmae TaxID=1776492 RepID=A0ABD5S044_9EURY
MVHWKHFALLFLGVCVAMTGALTWIGFADDDFRYAIDGADDDPPRGVTDIREYDGLTDRQRRIFDRARAGETIHFEDEYPMPRVVKRDGTYYTSVAPRYYDWTNPRTFVPALVFLAGVATMVHAVRLDIGTSTVRSAS